MANPFWAAKTFRLKKFCGRFTKFPQKFMEPSRLHQIRDLSGFLG